jgi:hypothetical protein
MIRFTLENTFNHHTAPAPRDISGRSVRNEKPDNRNNNLLPSSLKQNDLLTGHKSSFSIIIPFIYTKDRYLQTYIPFLYQNLFYLNLGFDRPL